MAYTRETSRMNFEQFTSLNKYKNTLSRTQSARCTDYNVLQVCASFSFIKSCFFKRCLRGSFLLQSPLFIARICQRLPLTKLNDACVQQLIHKRICFFYRVQTGVRGKQQENEMQVLLAQHTTLCARHLRCRL